MKNPYITNIIVTLLALCNSAALTEALRKLKLRIILGEAA